MSPINISIYKINVNLPIYKNEQYFYPQQTTAYKTKKNRQMQLEIQFIGHRTIGPLKHT